MSGRSPSPGSDGPPAGGQPPAAPGYERDEGLAAERTELAWGRSTLALFVCALAITRGLPEITGRGPEPVAGLVVLGAGALAWLGGVPYARARARAGRHGVRHVATAAELAPLAVGTALVGVAALVVAASGPG